MRIVVICGGGRAVGKTTLARALEKNLTGAVAVKFGEHGSRPEKTTPVFPLHTSFAEIVARYSTVAFLIIESGSILAEVGFEPDLVVFLPSAQGDKPGSDERRSRADIVVGQTDPAVVYKLVEGQLGLNREQAERVSSLMIP